MHGLFLWKTKKRVRITHAFQIILDESGNKPNKIWLDKGSEFCSRSTKSWSMIQKFIQHIIEGTLFVAERFIWTLKNKIYKYITSISKILYIDKLHGIANEYYNAVIFRLGINKQNGMLYINSLRSVKSVLILLHILIII